MFYTKARKNALQEAESERDKLKSELTKQARKISTLTSIAQDYETRFSKQISVEKQLEDAESKAKVRLQKLIDERNDINQSLSKLRRQIQAGKSELASISDDLQSLRDEHELFLDGYQPPVFELNDHVEYIMAIKLNRETQKERIRQKLAVNRHEEWAVGGSVSEGKRMVDRMVRLTLRAFNKECDLLVKNINWKNAERTKERIKKVAEDLDKLNLSMMLEINQSYIDLKLREVDLVNQEKIKKEEERERLRQQRELEREEAKAQREYMAEVKRQEKLEQDKQNALKAARERLVMASDEHRRAVEQEIREIEAELSEAILAKGRLLSMAEQTRIGHVYVISNKGSFGESMIKIGMTRRLDPMDRVKELGDASVPFPFDVHAIIFSEDAPALEKELHNHFAAGRVNKVNNRKEFFDVELDDVRKLIEGKIPGTPFEMNAMSSQYVDSCVSASKSLT